MATVLVRRWDDFVGQEQTKRRLDVHIKAAFAQKRPLDHTLLTGPPGMGKTTLAHLIAQELTDPILELIMPIDRRTLIQALQTFQGGVVFLDEIHAMTKRDQEILLPVLSKNAIVDQRGRSFPLGWITVIGATTERDKIIAPLDDRFPIRPDFVPYTDDEMGRIVAGMARQMELDVPEEVLVQLGRATGGIPRNAESLLAAYRDLLVSEPDGGSITSSEVLALCGLDVDGLGMAHHRYLKILADQGGRAGQKTVETLLRLPNPVLWEVERLLLEKGLIEFYPSGRELTAAGSNKVKNQDSEPYERS